ncbi:hypothetical protein AX761_12555 [Rhizobium sp. 58]|nr:hypothetical protein AX761_12555 [Rhizobium sp. 58]
MLTTEAGIVDLLDSGKRAAQAVILITHGLGSLESFQDIAEGLENRFPGRRIIAYSRPGRGSSPEPDGISPDTRLSHEAFQLLPALMRALDVTSADLIAHSDGVAAAMLFASTHPWMVDRIVAISPQVHANQHYVATTAELLAGPDCTRDIEHLAAEHADTESAIGCWAADRQALAKNPNHVLAHITTLTAPLLLIQGLRDDYGTQQQMDAISARVEGPMQWVILRKDGHHPQLDNMEVVLDLIARHIEKPMVLGAGHALAPASV